MVIRAGTNVRIMKTGMKHTTMGKIILTVSFAAFSSLRCLRLSRISAGQSGSVTRSTLRTDARGRIVKIDDSSGACPPYRAGHACAHPHSEAHPQRRHGSRIRSRHLATRAQPQLPGVLAFIFGGVLLTVIDWKVQRLPTRLVYLTLAGVAGGLAFASLLEWNIVPLATAVTGGLLFANAFCVLWYLIKKLTGMLLLGFGDVRLAAVLGLLLSWYGLEYVLYGALAGHVLALLLAVGIGIRQRKLLMHYSFGPPLIAGNLAVALFQAQG